MRQLLLPAAFASLLLLTGCAESAEADPTPGPTPSAVSPSPSAAADGPLACADLVGLDLVADALAGEDGESPEPVPARQPSADLQDLAVDLAGGLTCSWRIGAAEGNPLEYRDSDDWAYLRVRVLPGAADDW